MGAWPLVIGMALSAAGAGASAAAAAQAKAKMEKRTRQELARQREYQKKATGVYEQSLAQEGPEVAREQMAEGEQAALAAQERLQRLPGDVTTLPEQKNATVYGQKLAEQRAMTNRQAAGVFAPSEWQLQQWLKNMQANQMLAIQMRNAQASAGVLPAELATASHAGDRTRAIGGLLSALGSGVGMYGAMAQSGPATVQTQQTIGPPQSLGYESTPFGYQYNNPYAVG